MIWVANMFSKASRARRTTPPIKIALCILLGHGVGLRVVHAEDPATFKLNEQWFTPADDIIGTSPGNARETKTGSPKDDDSCFWCRKSRAEGWHLDLGFRWNQPKLGETRELLDRRLDGPLSLDWMHGFERPYTPLDRKTDWGFASAYLGFGREVNDWLIWNVSAGFSAGKDTNHDRVFLSTLDVDFKYRFFFIGTNVEVYPWKIPRVEPGMSFAQRVRASRPYILTGFETGYVHADGEGVYRVLWLPAYRDQAHIRDLVGSYLIGLGWDFPLSERFSLNVSGDYKFHFHRPDEYNGWNLITGLRYKF